MPSPTASSPSAIVTGAAGFLGRHVAVHLARHGWAVVGTGHGTLDGDEPGAWGLAAWHQGDVDAQSVAELIREHGRPDLVVHAAGGASVAAAGAQPLTDFRRTVVTTAELLEALRVHAPEARLVYPSSAAVYGDAGPGPIAEATPSRPVSAYGDHKRIAEELCLAAAARHGLSLAIVRFFSLYGHGLRKQLFWDLYGRLARGETPLRLGGTGGETRDFLHIDDATALIRRLAEPASGAPVIVNGGSGRATTIADAARALVAAGGFTAEPCFTGQVRAGDPMALVADTARLAAMGFAARRSLEDGLADYVGWAAQALIARGAESRERSA